MQTCQCSIEFKDTSLKTSTSKNHITQPGGVTVSPSRKFMSENTTFAHEPSHLSPQTTHHTPHDSPTSFSSSQSHETAHQTTGKVYLHDTACACMKDGPLYIPVAISLIMDSWCE